MSPVAKPYPKEFRDDVVAVARKGQASLSQIAKDFGISEGSLANWMKQADIESHWVEFRLISQDGIDGQIHERDA